MPERIGRYVVRGVLGKGTMGTVYQCWDEELARDVAVKVFTATCTEDDTLLERFRREARIVASLSHPGIVAVYDIGEDATGSYIAMEFVGAPTLRAAIRGGAPFDLQTKLLVAAKLCDALAAAHARGITHRDVKPENILVGSDGSAKLVDFGIAHLRDSTLTRPYDWLGTPAYAAPEVLQGAESDARSDLYSLAVSLFEWLTGERPHSADSRDALVAKIINEDAPDVRTAWPACPPAVAAVLARGLARDRGLRFPHAPAFAERLRDVAASVDQPPMHTADATTILLHPAAPAARRRTAWLPILGVVALLLAVSWVVTGSEWIAPLVDVPEPRARAAADVRLPALPGQRSPTPIGIHAKNVPAAVPSSSGGAPTPEVEPPADTGLDTNDEDEPVMPALRVGTPIVVTIVTELRTDRTRPGAEFEATLAEPLTVAGGEFAAAGTRVRGLVDRVFTGSDREPPALDLQLIELSIASRGVPLRTARYRVVGPQPGAGPGLAALIIGGAAGAVIGGALGGRTGAVAGGAIGAAGGAATGSKEDRTYHLGNRLTFKLAEELRISPRQ